MKGYYQFVRDNTVYYSKDLESLSKFFDFPFDTVELKNILDSMNGPAFYINKGLLSYLEGEIPERVVEREMAANIVDIFEDFLDEKGFSAKDFHQEKDNNEAMIYGKDFDILMDRVIDTLRYNEIIIPEVY